MVTGRHAARLPGHWTQRVGRGSVSGIVEGGCLRSDARAAAPQTVCAPSEGIHPIESVQPVWGHSTREARFHLIGSIAPDQNGLNDHRWGVSPHRQQAPSRTWSIAPLPRFCRRRLSGVYRHRPTRACAAGPVGVLSQRSARPCLRPSMSHVIPLRLVQMLNPHRWNCNAFGRSRKVTEGKLRAKYVWRLSGRRLRVPWLGPCLEAHPWPPTLRPLCLGVCRADDGGFCSIRSILPACRRRVVSKLGQALPPPINVARNSPVISSNVEPTSLELQRFWAVSKSDRVEITCEICLEVVGAPPAGAVARLVSRSAPALSGPPPSAPGCMLG